MNHLTQETSIRSDSSVGTSKLILLELMVKLVIDSSFIFPKRTYSRSAKNVTKSHLASPSIHQLIGSLK